MAETSLHAHPEMATVLKSDANAGGNFVENEELHRTLHHTKFPSIKGPEGNYDYPSFQGRLKDSPSFIKWNIHAQAPHSGYSLAPHRDNHPIVDPASGFISAGADNDLDTGVKRIPSMVQSSDKVQLGTPQTKPPNSGRPQTPPKAPWLEVLKPGDREAKYSDRKVSDIKLRASGGGWMSPTRVVAARSKVPENIQTGTFTFKPESWRDEAAKSYMLTSVTQNNFNAVDWDSILPPKIKPCESTLEVAADPIQLQANVWAKRYEAAADLTQRLGRSWDWFQVRDKCHGSRPYRYTSHYRKSGHIPYYDGSIGAYNFEAKDHPDDEYRPLTNLRTPKPRYTDTAHRPNIPHYKGCVHWTAVHPAHSMYPAPLPPSTAYIHRRLPTPPNTSPWLKKGPMSRMVTTVPPKNPFNQLKAEASQA